MVSAQSIVDDKTVRVRDGLATFGPEMLEVRQALEHRFLNWAHAIGADSMLFPPLIRASDLSRFDYFRNFPHLAVATSRIDEARLAEHCASTESIEEIAVEHLTPSRYLLPSAACYNVYLHLENCVLEGPRYITTVATCYRNEAAYDELQRLWSFSMREIVCVGTVEKVQAHLAHFKTLITAFSEELGLDLKVEFATDPFYEPQSSVARMQKLFPQKEELIYGDDLAIGSLNFHRNFFGERCNIRTADGDFAFTGCVAFGLERWFHALLELHHGDPRSVVEALQA